MTDLESATERNARDAIALLSREDEVGKDDDVGVEVMVGLVQRIEAHAGALGRLVAIQLLKGHAKYKACARAGTSENVFFRHVAAGNAELLDLLTQCERIGFSRTFEAELFSRALAGPEDRGSARLLEVALKQRDPSYRDKSDVSVTVVQQAREAAMIGAGGYAPERRVLAVEPPTP